MSPTNEKRARIHESLSFRAVVKADVGEAVAANTDGSKVRFARQPATTGANGRMEGCERQNWLEARRHANGVASG
jgi:hypothetical protein